MPEQNSTMKVAQWGVETVEGTLVPAIRRLTTVGTTVGPKFTKKNIRPRGFKINTKVVPGKAWSEADLVVDAYGFNEAPYLFSSVMRKVAPTRLIPTTGLAYQWLFTPQVSVEDVVQTYSLEQGSPAGAVRFPGAVINQLSMKWNRDAVDGGGAIFGRKMEKGITMTTTGLTDVVSVPFDPDLVSVWLDNTAAGLGGTKLLRVVSGEFNIGPRFKPLWVVDKDQASYAALLEGEMPFSLKLTMAADTQGMNLLDKMHAGDIVFARVDFDGAQIEAGPPISNYRTRIDMAATLEEPSKLSDSDGLYAITWTLTGNYDTTWAKALQVEVVNTLAAL